MQSYPLRYRIVNGNSRTASAFGFSASYQTSIKAKLTSLFADYYRIASSDVQSTATQGAIATAANTIEQRTGIVIIPKDIGILYTRFPVWDKTLDLPRGPLSPDAAANPLLVQYTTDINATNGNTMPWVTDTANASTNTVARLYTDRTFPYLSLVSGQVWPVPLWGDGYPVRVSGTFGVLSADYFTANSAEDCFTNYGNAISVLFQLALHIYENRMPVNIGNIVTEIPFTLEALIAGLQQ